MSRRRVVKAQKVLGNPEHVEIVRSGITAVRTWRKEHSGESLDIRGADLRGLQLAGADFSRLQAGASWPDERPTSLRDTVLQKANLSRAYLRLTDFSNCDLRNADLRGSQLSIADLSFADLRNARLGDCIFIGTDFHRAKLDGADFTNSRIGHTRFTATDLSRVTGLSTLQYHYPSTLDIDTLFVSFHSLPEGFLYGCGVPDALIAHLGTIVASMKPIEFDSCFISFSYSDHAFAQKLHSRLRGSGVRVWFSPEDMRGGRGVYDQVDRAIQLHDRLLLILSERSIMSSWVVTEIRRAIAAERREKRRKLFPIRLCNMESLRSWTCFDADTGKDLAVEVREYFIPDFSRWKNHEAFETAFKSLLRDLSQDDEICSKN